MTDCMVRQNCVLIKDSFDLTFGNGTVISLVGGNYLDPVDNADIISQAPSGLLVSCVYRTAPCLYHRRHRGHRGEARAR